MADDFHKGKRTVVTGGSGVIGKELLGMLINAGADILNRDKQPLPRDLLDNVRHVQKDLAVDDLQEFVEFNPQIVFHLAAEFERSTESPEFWEKNWRNNMVLSHRIADVVKNMDECEVFVFASSYLVYSPELYLFKEPPQRNRAINENDYVQPRNICGAAKFYTERELEFIREYYNPSMRVVSARIYRVYGLDSRQNINRWVRSVLGGKRIDVYNRQNRFDYIFSRDVAEGLLRLAASPEAAGCINLSSSCTRSIDDLLRILTEHLPETESLIVEHGIKDVFEASCGNLSMLKRMTGWSPLTILEKGIKLVIDHEKFKVEKE